MKFSSLKLVWKTIVGFIMPGTSVFESVTDYLLDLGNELLSKIPGARKEQISAIIDVAKTIYSLLEKYVSKCPPKWMKQYESTINAFKVALDSISDMKITKQEVKAIVSTWSGFYTEWMKDDVDDVPGDVKAVA